MTRPLPQHLALLEGALAILDKEPLIEKIHRPLVVQAAAKLDEFLNVMKIHDTRVYPAGFIERIQGVRSQLATDAQAAKRELHKLAAQLRREAGE